MTMTINKYYVIKEDDGKEFEIWTKDRYIAHDMAIRLCCGYPYILLEAEKVSNEEPKNLRSYDRVNPNTRD